MIVVSAFAGEGRSVWDRVFTREQAKRGELAYERDCARCHGENLAGGEASPALVGADFLSHWNGKTAGSLVAVGAQGAPAELVALALP